VNYPWLLDINNLSVGHPLLDRIMIDAAQYAIFVMFALFAVLLVDQGRRRRWAVVVLPMVVTLGVGYLLGLLAAALHPEPRPFTTHPNVHLLVPHPAGASFPSDHATAAFTIALAVTVFLSVRWGVLLGLLAVLIGFARVFDGLHYPGDIAGGLAVGLVATAVVAFALSLTGWRPFRSRDAPRVTPTGSHRQGAYAHRGPKR
jgi:undecaprenyl-diphosphatase